LHPENLSKRILQPVLKALGINLWDDGFRHSNATALDTLNPPMKLRHQRLGMWMQTQRWATPIW